MAMFNRPPRAKITPEALEAFRTMQRLERRCTCEDDDGECPACQEWWQQHSILHDELRLKPWQWPAYEHSGNMEPPSPENSELPDPGGPAARYRMLKQAAKGSIRSLCPAFR